MSEEKKAKDFTEDTPVEPKREPPEPAEHQGKETPEDMITRANAAAIRVEEANAKMEELIQKLAALQVQNTLGGTTEAGQPVQTAEEKADAAAKEMIKGSGFEDELFPDKK